MSTVRKFDPVSADDYLHGELSSTRKHEYVCGEVYAQAGGTNAHNRIASNVQGILFGQLRGNVCNIYNSDTKIRILSDDGARFFYPDAMVICESNPPSDTFQDQPVVIVEVLSASTRRLDLEEKRASYCRIPSLETYILLEQSEAAAIVFQKNGEGEFEKEVYIGSEQVIPLSAIGSQLKLSEVYEAVEFVSEDHSTE